MKTRNNSVIIIGAGFAGLAAGIYLQLNGYKSRIFEMHNKPGGLCTSWKRKGYTFDGCIHWLVGSSPKSGLHDLWEETGIASGRNIINIDQYCRIEGSDGRVATFYTDVDKLEKHLLEFSPIDEKPIKDFIEGIKMCLAFDPPSKHDSFFKKAGKQIKTASTFIRNGKSFRYWMKTTCEDFSLRFKDPVLRKAFLELWVPEFSMLFVLFTFGYLHKKNAGYPLGGSLPMSEAMEKKYVDLGGTVNYRSMVKEILTHEGKATGIKLENGSEYHADIIISASDGYNTLFKLLDGKYNSEKVLEPYNKWPLFPSLIYVSIGVDRVFNEVPHSISGISYHLKNPVLIGDIIRDRLSLHIYNHDHSMAPEGKTAITIMLSTDYSYWKNLSRNREEYQKKKEETGIKIIEMLEERFPGITNQVEVIDVATPLTFERYTGNWKGSFEGWLLTPENSGVIMKPMSQKLPGLENFYMCGQWVEPGGGLPTSVMSAKRLVKTICREDKVRFRS